MADNTEWVWLHNPETGGTARFPVLAREGWEARGWVEVDAPPADDGTGTPIGVQDNPEDQGSVDDQANAKETEPVTAKKATAKKNKEVTDNG